MKASNYFLAGCLLCIVCGCVTTKVDLTNSSASYEPTSRVEYLYKKPSRKFKVIAVIKGRGSYYRRESLVFDKIIDRAKKIGAQAIIPLHSSINYAPKMTINKEPILSIEDAIGRMLDNREGGKFNLEVAAIQFVDSDSTKKENTAPDN